MTITFRCSGCDRELHLDEEMAGRPARCSTCGSVLRVPAHGGSRAVPSADDLATAATPAARRAGSRVRVLVVGLCGGLVLGGLITGLLWAHYFTPSALDPDLRYLPDDCAFIRAYRVDQILGSDAHEEYLEELKKNTGDRGQTLDPIQLGLSSDNIAHVTVAGRFNSFEDVVAIVRTHKPVSVAEVWSLRRVDNYRTTRVGSHDLYEAPGFPALAMPEDKVLLYGPPARLRAILERGRKAQLSTGMKAILDQADFTQSVTYAVNLEDAPVSSDEKRLPRGPLESPTRLLDRYLDVPAVNALDQLQMSPSLRGTRGFVQQARFGWEIEDTLVICCSTESNADHLRQSIQTTAERRYYPGYGSYDEELDDSLSVTARGSVVVLQSRYQPANNLNKPIFSRPSSRPPDPPETGFEPPPPGGPAMRPGGPTMRPPGGPGMRPPGNDGIPGQGGPGIPAPRPPEEPIR